MAIEKKIMTLVEHDITRKSSWKTGNKSEIGICLHLPFNLFLPGKRERPAKYDETLMKVDAEICLFDARTDTRTHYVVKKIAKRDKNYAYYVYLIEL